MFKIFFNLSDPIGKPGLGFFGAGYLLHIGTNLPTTLITPRLALIFAWGAFIFSGIGAVYYLFKIYHDFIKKSKKNES
jgi:hypothetical protein